LREPLLTQFNSALRRFSDAPAFTGAGESWTYGRLAAAASRLQQRIEGLAGRDIGVRINDVPLQLTAILAASASGVRPVLLPAGSGESAQRPWQCGSAAAEVLSDDHPLISGVREASLEPVAELRAIDNEISSEVVLFTSGTSGPPRPVRHHWQSLASAVHRKAEYERRRWLLAFDPASFAGIQVWLQSLLTGGTLCIPASRDPAEIATSLTDCGVQFASGTPTMWRMVLAALGDELPHKACLSQITLGGEVADQPLLDRLRATFPNARITHIYASTEMGVCFSVPDGRAGFPAALLDEPPATCELKIGEDGELLIRSSRAMQGYLEGANQPPAWFPTGDRVERRGDRVYFAGRGSGAINVGGRKVYPEHVEAVIRAVPGILQTRVTCRPSSIVGQLAQAEVVAAANEDQDELRMRILRACRAQLAEHQIPAEVRFCKSLALTQTGKLARCNPEH